MDNIRELSAHEKFVLSEVCRVIGSMPNAPDHAGTVQRRVAAELSEIGADVIMEYPMPYMSKRPIQGRIDIHAVFMGAKIAIEIDARKPRRASVQKLKSFNGIRIAATRGVSGDPPEGIDALVAIPVRLSL